MTTGTEVSVFKAGVPAYLQTKEAMEVNKALNSRDGGFGKKISIKGSVFRMVVDGEEVAKRDERSMNVVIVAASPDTTRMYYEDTYKDGVAAAPVCWSKEGIKPEEESQKPQADLCASCPQNISGSGHGTSRACRYSRKIAVVLENDLKGAVYQMQIPAESLFGKGEGDKLPLLAFTKFMIARNAPITGYVTKLSFDTNSATPKLFFMAVRALDEDEFSIVLAQGHTPEAVNAITTSVTIPKEEDTAVQLSENTAEKKPKVKAKTTVKTEPEKKSPVSDILSKWADDTEGE
jgi:hypothetical protein